MKRTAIMLLWLAACAAVSSASTLRLPAIIGDNAVLQQDTDITLWGWLPREILDTYPGWSVEKEMADSTLQEYERINVMYNAMLNHVAGYTLRGFPWNQGESNVGRHAEYPAHQADMVAHWRERWGDQRLPFYYVELPAWNYSNPSATNAALFRECQNKAESMIPNFAIGKVKNMYGMPLVPFRTDDWSE